MKRAVLFLIIFVSVQLCAQVSNGTDWEKMNLPAGTEFVKVTTLMNGRVWAGWYLFTSDGQLAQFRSMADSEELFTWNINEDSREDGERLLVEVEEDSVTMVEMQMYDEDDEYPGCISSIYKGYYAIIYPQKKGFWQLRYIDYCSDPGEDWTDDCEEKGMQKEPYPLVEAKDLAFYTRNYAKEPVPLYEKPYSGSKMVATIRKAEVRLNPYAVDWMSDMVLIKYKGKWCWIEMKWMCSNPYSYCS